MVIDGIEVRDIPGFPNYAISRDGRVWSKARKSRHNHIYPGIWLKPKFHKCGYPQYGLWRDNKITWTLCHRLVLESWVGPCPPGKECRHLDGNPANNHLSNLKWGTAKENQEDRVRHGTQVHGSRQGLTKLTEGDMRFSRYLRWIGFPYKTIAAKLNVTIATIGYLCTNKTWRHVS